MSVFVATFASVRVTHVLFGCEMRRWEITDQDGSQACTCGSSLFTDLCSFAICCDHISSFLKIMIHHSRVISGPRSLVYVQLQPT